MLRDQCLVNERGRRYPVLDIVDHVLFQTLLVQFWYPMTVATISYYNKQTIAKYLSETSDNQTCLPNMFVDLGLQGSTSVEVSMVIYSL